jgi:hypothetical protein
MLTQLLASGSYLHVDADLHQRRVQHDNSAGRQDYSTMGFNKYWLPLALVYAKLHVIVESTIAAYRGSHSFLVACAAFLSSAYQNLLYIIRFTSFTIINVAVKILTRTNKLIAPW